MCAEGSGQVTDWVIWGNAGHALVLAELIAARGDHVAAIVDRVEGDSVLPGTPLLVGEGPLRAWRADRPGPLSGVAAIGGGRGRDRIEVHRAFTAVGISPTMLAAETSMISRSARIGPGSQVLPGAIVGPNTVLGEACIVNHRASVDHECRLGVGVHVSPGAILTGLIDVGDFTWVGAGATILPRLTIGQDAIIAAGAVVTRDVPPGSTVMGVPAREKSRQSEAG